MTKERRPADQGMTRCRAIKTVVNAIEDCGPASTWESLARDILLALGVSEEEIGQAMTDIRGGTAGEPIVPMDEPPGIKAGKG